MQKHVNKNLKSGAVTGVIAGLYGVYIYIFIYKLGAY